MLASPFTKSLGLIAVATFAIACGVHTAQNGAVQITSITPGTGSITGGLPIAIEGQGIDDGSGTATVLFGSSPAKVTSVSGGVVNVTLPSGLTCGNVDVQLSNSNGSAFKPSAFNYTGGTGALSIASVAPAQGDIGGGTHIVITGTGFTGGVGITLGGLPLENIQIVNDTQISANTPLASNGGQVDLAMRNCASQASLPASFIYVTGLNGGVVDLNLTTYTNPAQFGTPTPTPSWSDPYVAFIEPSTESLVTTLPAPGTCVFNAAANPPPAVTLMDAGATVQLSKDATTLTLSKQTGGDYYFPYDVSGNLTAEHYQAASGFVPGGTYAVDATGGAIPAFTVTNAFTAPTGYNITAPTFPATPVTIPRGTALPFTWTGGSAGTSFQIELIGYANDGTSANQRLRCVAAADGVSGSFTVSATDMSRFTTATTQFLVYTNRRVDTEFTIPSNGSKGIALASLYKVGRLFF